MFTEIVENLLNRNLGSSPRARELCMTLKGRRLKLIVRDLGVEISLESLGQTLQISRLAGGEFQVEVEGSPVNLLALAGPQPERLIKSGAVQLRGDVELLTLYRDLVLLLRPDLEEELAKLLGDAAAHRLAGFAKAALSLGRRGADTAVQNAAEFFAHETRDLVPRAEAEEFLADVDRLREDVDRTAARFDALLARIAPRETAADPLETGRGDDSPSRAAT